MSNADGDGSGYGPSNGVTTGLTCGTIVFVGVFFIVTTITILSYLCGCCGRLTSPQQRSQELAGGELLNSVAMQGGLDESTLLSYPELTYAQALLEKSTSDPMITNCCSICLEDYKDSDVLRQVPDCFHLFHLQCVDPWLKLHASCPICRTSLLPSLMPTLLQEAVAPSSIHE